LRQGKARQGKATEGEARKGKERKEAGSTQDIMEFKSQNPTFNKEKKELKEAKLQAEYNNMFINNTSTLWGAVLGALVFSFPMDYDHNKVSVGEYRLTG